MRVWNREKPMIEIGSVRVRARKKSNGREWDSEVGRGTMRPWVRKKANDRERDNGGRGQD